MNFQENKKSKCNDRRGCNVSSVSTDKEDISIHTRTLKSGIAISPKRTSEPSIVGGSEVWRKTREATFMTTDLPGLVGVV